MSAYTYESYRFTGRPPMVRIMRNVSSTHTLPDQPDWTLNIRASWPWQTHTTLDLGDDIMLDVLPHTDDLNAQRSRYGIVAYGRVYALVRKWGATMPIDLADPRVVERLRLREAMEAM
jgi:hypothetical protein